MKITIQETGEHPDKRLLITFGDMFIWETTPVEAAKFGQIFADKARHVHATVADDPRHDPVILDVKQVAAAVI